jgi:PAP2 superfamily
MRRPTLKEIDMPRIRLPVLHACVLALVASLPAKAQTAADTVVLSWNAAALEEVRRGRLGPPVVARALAIAHTCVYDAWVPYDDEAAAATQPLPRRPPSERNDANKARAISHAAYNCLLNLFPAGAGRLSAEMRRLGFDPNDMGADTATPQGIGNGVAAAVIASRRHDGSNQYGDLSPGAYSDYTGYTPVNAPMPFCLPATPGPCPLNVSNPFQWQPLINDRGVTQVAIAPHWREVRPFALLAATQFDHVPGVADGPNYLLGPTAYDADIEDLLSYSRHLTEAQKLVVEYWADGPESELPPGHWALFAQHVSRRDGHSIDEDARMFFALSNATFDAGIVAWHIKRKFDGVRPITGIRFFRQGQPLLAWGGPGRPVETIEGGKWTPYNPGSNLTPSFPGYVSGHSTFSAAGAVALRGFTGSDRFEFSTVVPPGFGRVEPGVPRVPTTLRYATYSAAVAEAGLSRLLGGIHFADDNTDGQLLGNLSGAAVWDKSQRLFAGNLPNRAVAAGQSVTCRDTTLGAQTVANVTIPADARCLLLGTRVEGNIALGSGAALQASGAVIAGNVQGQGTADVRLAGGSLDGSVQILSGRAVTLLGVRINGSVQLRQASERMRLQDLVVAGDIQLLSNRGPIILNANRAQGNLQCSGNQAGIVGSGNQAQSREGQCSALPSRPH